MRRHILTCIAACFYYSGLVALARWWMQRGQEPRLVILNYHRASGGNLRQHLLYLQRHYRILPVDSALAELYGQKKATSTADRRPLLALTFDDGYHDNYSHAFALARQLQIPLTFYLIPDYIEHPRRFWWFEGRFLARQTSLEEVVLEDQIYHLYEPEERLALARCIDTRLRFAPSVAERERFLAATRQVLGVEAEFLPEELPMQPLSWELIREMTASGLIFFGAHTLHHPILSALADIGELHEEIEGSRQMLEQQLGSRILSFAYPVGQWQHIDQGALLAVQKAGFRWALTTHYGYNTPHSSPYLLKRIEADVSQHWLVVAAESAGLWGLLTRLRWVPFIRRNYTNATNAY